MALGGYCAFQSKVDGNILNNFSYSNSFANIARTLLALTMVFTYPMESYVARHCLYTLIYVRCIAGKSFSLYPWSRPNPRVALSIIALLLWIVSVSIALNVSKVGPVLELSGTFAASILSYVLPNLIHIRAHGFYALKDEASKALWSCDISYKQRCHALMSFWFSIFLIIFGFIVCVVGTATVLFLES